MWCQLCIWFSSQSHYRPSLYFLLHPKHRPNYLVFVAYWFIFFLSLRNYSPSSLPPWYSDTCRHSSDEMKPLMTYLEKSIINSKIEGGPPIRPHPGHWLPLRGNIDFYSCMRCSLNIESILKNITNIWKAFTAVNYKTTWAKKIKSCFYVCVEVKHVYRSQNNLPRSKTPADVAMVCIYRDPALCSPGMRTCIHCLIPDK